jgi:membrane-bound serine protease (ClpP class)
MALIRGLLLALAWSVSASAAPVAIVPLEGAIGPAAADFVRRSIERAGKEGAQLIVLRMDTPGGLDTSMREIIRAILASPVPVATFVAPSGARAASAGTFIMYASHIAAMAPGTNVGAASPVALMGGGESDKEGKKGGGDVMMKKAMNDAVAYIRGFAQMRGRNADWAEKAVRDAVSIPAEEALKLKVIDVIAPDVPSLLKALQGKTLEAGGVKRTLQLAGAAPQEMEPDWRTRFLGVITNPSVAYLLILLGAYALLFEFMNPGLVLPGVVGAIALLLALYALHLLPVNYAGLGLIALGIGFMAAEAFVPAYGSLGVGGLIAFVLGSIMLIEDTALPDFEIPIALIAGMAAASAGFLIFIVGMLLKSRRQAIVTGREQMIGARGEALGDFDREGWARVRGEQWQVRSARAVRRGERLRVIGMHGLVLDVEPEGD